MSYSPYHISNTGNGHGILLGTILNYQKEPYVHPLWSVKPTLTIPLHIPKLSSDFILHVLFHLTLHYIVFSNLKPQQQFGLRRGGSVSVHGQAMTQSRHFWHVGGLGGGGCEGLSHEVAAPA